MPSSDTSDALSDISIHAAANSSPAEANPSSFAFDASESTSILSSLRKQIKDIQDYFMALPESLKRDFMALVTFQVPSKEIILILLIPSIITLLFGILLVILLVRIVHGARREATNLNYKASFIVFGDYGRNGQYGQQKMADQLEEYCSGNRCDFVVTTGDNIYNTGVQSSDDVLFKTSFEDVYLKGSLKNLKYYHVLGNHDWAGKPSAMIEYANRDDTAWILKDYYYDEYIEDANLQFVFADTTPFNPVVYPFSNKDEMETRHTEEALQQQVDFVRSTLQNSKAKWKFVVAHHPFYSAAQHGDNADVAKRLEPAMKATGTDGLIAGHDHNQQVLERSNIDHFISGAASRLREVTMPDHWNLKWYDSHNGFMHFHVSDDHVLVQAIRSDDMKVIYEHKITKEDDLSN
mmetsp:Transcript_3541/g.13550  ORF Transcript_3541/g.13550 Transcript_3541/m.13550 type:complete len:407 (+) Transcript_3541:215-1435(+)